jgi:hypothetical protein
MKDIETYKTYGKEWENELLKIPSDMKVENGIMNEFEIKNFVRYRD